jgi:hypothetical protein
MFIILLACTGRVVAMVVVETHKHLAFKSELAKTAAAIVAKGKGILAADESTGTIGIVDRMHGA